MEYHILFTTDKSRHVQRYTAAEMAEIFTASQLGQLKRGEAVQVNDRTTAVDLIAFYDKG